MVLTPEAHSLRDGSQDFGHKDPFFPFIGLRVPALLSSPFGDLEEQLLTRYSVTSDGDTCPVAQVVAHLQYLVL